MYFRGRFLYAAAQGPSRGAARSGREISALAGARAEGEAKGRQEAICKYLDARFGEASRDLQERVRQIDSLEILDKIINKVYIAGSLEEVKVVIDGAPN